MHMHFELYMIWHRPREFILHLFVFMCHKVNITRPYVVADAYSDRLTKIMHSSTVVWPSLALTLWLRPGVFGLGLVTPGLVDTPAKHTLAVPGR